MANSRLKKEILLKQATDKELLAESLRRRNIEPNAENVEKYRLFLMDKPTHNALRYLKFSQTKMGGVKIEGPTELKKEELDK